MSGKIRNTSPVSPLSLAESDQERIASDTPDSTTSKIAQISETSFVDKDLSNRTLESQYIAVNASPKTDDQKQLKTTSNFSHSTTNKTAETGEIIFVGNDLVPFELNATAHSNRILEAPYGTNSVLLKNGNMRNIEADQKHLQSFIDTVSQKLESRSIELDEGTAFLAQLEAYYRKLEKAFGSRLNSQLEQLLVLRRQLEPIVRELNNQAERVTTRDVNMIGAFFQPPLEKRYTDPIDNRVYMLADNSQLLALATTQCLGFKGYKGYEISKCNRITNPDKLKSVTSNESRSGNYNSHIYDAIFLEKPPLQISFENGLTKYVLRNKNVENIVSNQSSICGNLFDVTCRNYRNWGYAGVALLTTPEQLEAIVLPENATRYHAILLFLKPLEHTSHMSSNENSDENAYHKRTKEKFSPNIEEV